MAAGCTIGVDLGGTKLLAARVDADGSPGPRLRRRIAGLSLEDLIATTVEAVQAVASEAGPPVRAVGAGIPSQIDGRSGRSVRSNHLPLDDVPFGVLLEERLELPVAVDNDGNCAVLAEWRAGAAAGCRDVVMLTLGTGIGGGLVLGGALFRGATGAGAELGHMVVDLDGPPCFGDCPGRGCLEALASGSALERDAALAVAADPGSALAAEADQAGRVPGEAVTRLAANGDALASTLVRDLGTRLGAGLAGLAMVFEPEVMVIGGGLGSAGELLLEPAREELVRRTMGPPRRGTRVVSAALGEDAGMLGAAMLAREVAA